CIPGGWKWTWTGYTINLNLSLPSSVFPAGPLIPTSLSKFQTPSPSHPPHLSLSGNHPHRRSSIMATIAVLGSLHLPRSSSISPSSLLSPNPRSLPLPLNLRFSSSSSSRRRSSLALHSFRRRSSIVCEAQNTTTEVAAVTEKSWQSLVIESETPVLVEFWAPWCGPCRMIHPVIDELAKQYAGKLKCYKLNTDDSPSVATQYGIRSIPTVIIFKQGEKKDAVIGAVPKSTLTTSIEKFL
ncbi:Thioredoxin M-type, chloroplastic, partial [Linum grandiflorum]